MSTTAPAWPLRGIRAAGLIIVAVLLALTAAFGTRTSAEATTDRSPSAAATVQGCGYGYICLYEGYNYAGTIHRLYNCEYYYTPYAFHSVVNNQTTGTRANFYAKRTTGTGPGSLIWTSRAALWSSGNVDGIAGGLGSRTWYVKPC